MRKTTCSTLGIWLGTIGIIAVGAATPTWSSSLLSAGHTNTRIVDASAPNERAAVRALHYRHHVRHVARTAHPPADRVEFGAAARIPPMRPHTGGTK